MLKYLSSFIWDDDVEWCQKQKHLKYMTHKQILKSNMVLHPPPPSYQQIYEMKDVKKKPVYIKDTSTKCIKKRRRGKKVHFLDELKMKIGEK